MTDDPANNMEVEIYSTTGKIMHRVLIGNPGLIDLSGLGFPDGIYILSVKTSGYSGRRAVILAK
jgi:phage tail protein X